MIDFTTMNVITSAITLSGSYGDSTASANSKISLDVVKSVYGTQLTKFDNCVKIGAGVSRVLISASVFYSGSNASYGWFVINKNSTDTGYRAIAYKSSSSYGTATLATVMLDVQENDVIKVWNIDASTVRGNASYLTVLAIG